MKRIPTVLGAAAALTLLVGCAGGGTYGTYYGGGYSGTGSYGYRQPYNPAIGTTNTIAGTQTTIIPEIPITTPTVAITAADTRACQSQGDHSRPG